MSFIYPRKEEKMIIKIEKPDYYIILKKRRKTIEKYLQEQKINSKLDLDNHLKYLAHEYKINEQFILEADRYIETMENKFPSVEKPKNLTDENLSTEDNLTEEKTKKRSKKSSKKDVSNIEDADSLIEE